VAQLHTLAYSHGDAWSGYGHNDGGAVLGSLRGQNRSSVWGCAVTHSDTGDGTCDIQQTQRLRIYTYFVLHI
jgi:hypothetical protein